MYFCNTNLFKDYVKFIKAHTLFSKEIYIKPDTKEPVVKIIKQTIPTLKSRGITEIDRMNRAKRVKNDEFYTRYEDVKKELDMYDVKIWKDKTVFCNCDDAVGDAKDRNDNNTSAFALYFLNNFERLELKKLICTHYSGGDDLFRQGPKGYIHTCIFTKTKYKEYRDFPKGYNGSFDDPLSLKILNEEADIVCTNPPWSKGRIYWDYIIKSGKKFLIISSITNVIHTTYIRYFKDKKMWSGYHSVDEYLTGNKAIKRSTGYWYTNFPIKNRPSQYRNLKFMPLKEIPDKYKRYDNTGVLIVEKSYIPTDYKKPFAVSARQILNGVLEKGYKIARVEEYVPLISSEDKKISTVLIQKI